MKQFNSLAGVFTFILVASFSFNVKAQWSLTGNSGTNSATNFIGTKDTAKLRIVSDSVTLATFDGIHGIATFIIDTSKTYIADDTAIGDGLMIYGNYGGIGRAYSLGELNSLAGTINGLAILPSQHNYFLGEAGGTFGSNYGLQIGGWVGEGDIMLGYDSARSGYYWYGPSGSGSYGYENGFVADELNGRYVIGRQSIGNNTNLIVDDALQQFTFNKNIQIQDGTQGAGKVLTSDSTGLASWQPASNSTWGLTGNSGTNSGINSIGTKDAQGLNISTNDTTRIHVDSLGNIGIGTSFPNAQLNIVGKNNKNTNIPLYIASANGDPLLTAWSGGHLGMLSNDTLDLKTPSGNTDYTSLVVKGGTGTLQYNQNSLWMTGDEGQYPFSGMVTAYLQAWANESFILTTFSDHPLVFGTHNAERMRLTDVGIGINTTSPSVPLEVNGQVKITDGTQAAGKVLTSDSAGLASWQSASASDWGLKGNAGTNSGTNFIGTTDNTSLRIATRDTNRVVVDSLGNVAIGSDTIPGGFKLAVNGKIICEEVKVQLHGGWPDFVFNKDYDLMSLGDLDKFVLQNKHLPDMPSEAMVTKDGTDIGDIQKKLLQKIEELTLYLVKQNENIEQQAEQIKLLNQQVSELSKTTK